MKYISYFAFLIAVIAFLPSHALADTSRLITTYGTLTNSCSATNQNQWITVDAATFSNDQEYLNGLSITNGNSTHYQYWSAYLYKQDGTTLITSASGTATSSPLSSSIYWNFGQHTRTAGEGYKILLVNGGVMSTWRYYSSSNLLVTFDAVTGCVNYTPTSWVYIGQNPLPPTQLSYTLVPSTTATTTYDFILEFPTEAQGSGFAATQGVANTNVYGITGNWCHSFNSSSIFPAPATTTFRVNMTDTHSGIIDNGSYADCSGSGLYYINYHSNISGKDYYASYFYSATTTTITPQSGDSILTKIIDVQPRNGTTTATSSSFTVSTRVYIAADDIQDGTYVRLYFYRKSSVQQISKVQAWEDLTSTSTEYRKEFEWPVTIGGYYTFSTTTDISNYENGEYAIIAEIHIPGERSLWDILKDALSIGSGNTPDESKYRWVDTFVLGQITAYDQVVHDIVSSRDLNGISLDSCLPVVGSFNMADCLYLLFIPSQAQMETLWYSLYDSILTQAPFGYVTRFLNIITSSEATIPPAFSYTFDSNAPSTLQGETITIQPFDKLDELNSIETTTHQTIWDVVMPFVNLLVALGVLGVILNDLLGIQLGSWQNSNVDDVKLSRREQKIIEDAVNNPYTDEEMRELKRNKLI